MQETHIGQSKSCQTSSYYPLLSNTVVRKCISNGAEHEGGDEAEEEIT